MGIEIVDTIRAISKCKSQNLQEIWAEMDALDACDANYEEMLAPDSSQESFKEINYLNKK